MRCKSRIARATLGENYDDGGFSGGNMERPALGRLLEAVDRGAVDVVVVYKVDRLTRSLTDFAKIVERFEAKGVSFVSVTQSFNTTSSMGRLTLNVLLSFAQFEREVTGERIRDKIAASKAKGLWMGGNLPLGYDPNGRTLVINNKEAGTVRFIFKRYLELGTVHALVDDLDAKGIRSKSWTTRKGRRIESARFVRGALYYLLRNRLYRGEIRHKGQVYAGQHPAIIDAELFDAVQASLDAHVKARTNHWARPGGSPLTGILFDASGDPMSSSHSRGKSGGRYRYYVSSGALKGQAVPSGVITRVPAQAIEDLVRDRLTRILDQTAEPAWEIIRKHVERVSMRENQVVIIVRDVQSDIRDLRAHSDPSDVIDLEDDKIRLTIPVKLKQQAGAVRFLSSSGRRIADSRPQNSALLKTLALAHRWRAALSSGSYKTIADLATAEGFTESYARQRLRLAFLAPDIARAITEARAPPELNS